MTQNLIITRGIPSSGKSTWAKNWVKESPPTRSRVCRDEIRFATFGSYSGLSYDQEEIVTKIEQASVNALLSSGKDVCIDAMHVRPVYIRNWQKWLHNLGLDVNVQIKEFPIDLETAIERDAQREKSVGQDVLLTIWQKFTRKGNFLPVEDWTPDAGGSEGVEPYVPNVDAPRAIIVDIDGTIAAKTSSRGYHDYHRVSEDTPRHHVIDIVKALAASGDQIVFLSGRPDSCEKDTREWLTQNLGWIGKKFPLFMRKDGDYRKDFIIKKEIFDSKIRENFRVICAIDDRPTILRLWDSMGIPVIDVAPFSGEF